MPDTVNVPGVGPAQRKWVLAGGALVAGIVGYAYLKRSRQAAAAEVTPPTPSELPPADLAGVSTGGGTTSTGLKFITTNAEWSQDATDKLVALGYDAVAVSTALGKYLANQFVTAQEAQYIYTAIALSGHPPVGSFSVRLEPTPTSTSSPPKPGVLAAPTGLHARWDAPHKQYIISWGRVAGATGYGLYRSGVPVAFVRDTDKAVGNRTATYTVKAHDARRYSRASAPLHVTRHT